MSIVLRDKYYIEDKCVVRAT